ncbi:MAG TPA: zf-HC2 domain-containing protein [Pyrinomonadaceae bacterium]|nr:zf-HC2 domain-containing protein [Pyrinomonadaceae bacterium]
MMKENLKQSVSCARAEDLVTYLYGEASKSEAVEFERHIERCDSCRNELAAFSRVREDVIEWRNQSLPSFESSHAVAPVLSEAPVATRKRSALAAFREFFTLSPIWMRAATAMAVIVVCALLVFTVAHFSETPGTVVKVVPTGPTQAEVSEMVKKQAEELRRKEQQEAAVIVPEQRSAEVLKGNGAAPPVKTKRSAGSQSSAVAKKQNQDTPDKVKSSQEVRQQLAELVQRQKEDDGLPRLSDLIDDSNEAQ